MPRQKRQRSSRAGCPAGQGSRPGSRSSCHGAVTQETLCHALSLSLAQRAPAPQAPDYPPYTKWTDTVPKDLGGFSVEIGHALEAVCGVKVDFILDSWSSCFTVKPDRIYFRRGAPHTLSSLTTTKGLTYLSPCACKRGERVRGRRHLKRPRPRLHRVHAHQGGARPLARVHARHHRRAEDSWHPHAPRALHARPPMHPHLTSHSGRPDTASSHHCQAPVARRLCGPHTPPGTRSRLPSQN